MLILPPAGGEQCCLLSLMPHTLQAILLETLYQIIIFWVIYI